MITSGTVETGYNDRHMRDTRGRPAIMIATGRAGKERRTIHNDRYRQSRKGEADNT